MNKAFGRVIWQNYPNKTTPLSAQNLNKGDLALDTIDDRVIVLDATKADKTDVASLVKDVTLNESTGVITVTKNDGTKKTYDTALEKIATNFSYDRNTQRMILYGADGSVVGRIDLSEFITEYEFKDSDIIAFSVTNHMVSADIKDNSITDKKMQPNYLADVQAAAKKAGENLDISQASANAAAQSAEEADYYAKISQSYAVGGSGVREDEDIDNSKFYRDQAKAISGLDFMTDEIFGLGRPDRVTTTAKEGVFSAKGVAIFCTINKAGVEHGANWLKYGPNVITPNPIQLYLVYIDGEPSIWSWDGNEYKRTSKSGTLVSILKEDFDALDADDREADDLWWWISDMDGNVDGYGALSYNDLKDKPSINGHVLIGNKTSAELGIEGGGSWTSATAVMKVDKWSNKRYSFETDYPFATYDVEIEPDGDIINEEQYKQWCAAGLVGSLESNSCKAMYDIPTVDIPVMLRIMRKS